MTPILNEQPKVVADVMTRSVVTLFEEDDLEHIEEAMDKFRFRHVPVVDDGKLVGLVTRSDLRCLSSSRFDPAGPARDDALRKRLFVRDIMTTDIRTVHPDTPIVFAAGLMRDARIGCLPVVESDDRLVGIITSTDMLDLIASGVGGQDWAPSAKRLPIPRPRPRADGRGSRQPVTRQH